MGRFVMSSSTCCKLKALMILAMLAVSEGRRLQQMSVHNDRLKLRKAFNSRAAAGNKVSHSLDSDPGALVDSPMDALLNDPAFKEQLVAMAGHIDELAVLIKKKAPPSLLTQANKVFKLSTDSKSVANSTLPKDMELMIADQDFQKHVEAFVVKMQENVELNADLQDSVDAASSQQMLKIVSDKVAQVTTDPQFQQTLRRVSEALASLMQDPEISVHAESLAAYLESVKESEALDIAEKFGEQLDAMIANKKLKAFDIAEKFGEQVDAQIANKKLKAKASAVVYEMLKAESKDGSEFAVEDELVEDKTLEAEKEAHASFLEEWSGQEDHIPLLAVHQLLAVKTSEAAPAFQAKGFAGTNRIATPDQLTYRPAFGDWRRQSKDSQMKDLGLGSEEGAEETSALQQTELAPVLLASAHGILSKLPSLQSALLRRGGFSNDNAMANKDEDGLAKARKLHVPLLLCLALRNLSNYYYSIGNKPVFAGAALIRAVVGLMLYSMMLYSSTSLAGSTVMLYSMIDELIVLACLGGHHGVEAMAVLHILNALSIVMLPRQFALRKELNALRKELNQIG